MQKLTDGIRHGYLECSLTKNYILDKTGEVIATLQVFTEANFTDAEQEIIYEKAKEFIEQPNTVER